MTTTYKLVLIGDGGVGKSTWVNRLNNDLFEQRYIPTLGVELHPVMHGKIKFNIWDTAGQEKLGGLRDGYYINADCAIVMFDWSKKMSIKNLQHWISEFNRVCPNKPIVVVGNKKELANESTLKLIRDLGISCVNISVRDNVDIRAPFANFMF